MQKTLAGLWWLALVLTASLAALAGCGDDEPSTACGANTCTGCCANGRCVAGSTTSACGSGGAACEKCSGGQSCSNGECTAGCGPQSCATGCCQSGACQAGNQVSACGNAGMMCVQCSSGQTCDPNSRTCLSGTCNASTCPGCCQNNLCQQGTSPSACGMGGGACNVCGGGQTCDPSSRTCVVGTCTAQTCATGCCLGNQCFTDHASNHCGSGAQPCQTCVAPQTCLASGATYVCQGGGGESYKVTLVSAVLGKKTNGDDWDDTQEGCVTCLVGCCPPDAYADSGSIIAGMAVPRVVMDNTFTPTWNAIVGNAPATQLTNGAVTITIKDSDSIPPDDAMGACSGTVTAADLAAGQKVLTTASGCTGAVQSLTISFTRI